MFRFRVVNVRLARDYQLYCRYCGKITFHSPLGFCSSCVRRRSRK